MTMTLPETFCPKPGKPGAPITYGDGCTGRVLDKGDLPATAWVIPDDDPDTAGVLVGTGKNNSGRVVRVMTAAEQRRLVRTWDAIVRTEFETTFTTVIVPRDYLGRPTTYRSYHLHVVGCACEDRGEAADRPLVSGWTVLRHLRAGRVAWEQPGGYGVVSLAPCGHADALAPLDTVSADG